MKITSKCLTDEDNVEIFELVCYHLINLRNWALVKSPLKLGYRGLIDLFYAAAIIDCIKSS